MPKIQVGEKALAHLSRGLYRSPASALRELVSNAWDANARSVHITTNYPDFYAIAIQDTGDGFPKSEFQRLMQGGIGNSQKDPADLSLDYGRPTIGRLGIGMLGIAQICGSFTVTSRTKDGDGFKATITFYDLLREKLDSNDSGVVIMGHDDKISEIDVGEYRFDESFDPMSVEIGTKVFSDDLHPTFSRSFQESVEGDDSFQVPDDWGDVVKVVSRHATLQELGDYWRLLWELAASCPVAYIDSEALPNGLIEDDNDRLLSYNFKLYVDGRELKKPVYLKNNANGYTTSKIENTEFRIYGRDVKFHGYIVIQEGSQLKPDELRGLMIRIKNVGIGYYDHSLLDYRYNEGPRSRWITGEIYIDSGLEGSLNIDRDSFNRFHPEFREVQSFVHRLLRKEVFPNVYRQIEVRSKRRAAKISDARGEQLKKVAESGNTSSVQIVFEGEGAPSSVPVASATQRNEEIVVRAPKPASIKLKKSQQQLASSILALYALASLEDTPVERERVFASQLIQLLSKW